MQSGSDSKDVSLLYSARISLPELESIVSSTCVTGRAGQPFTFPGFDKLCQFRNEAGGNWPAL